jgi:ankyrin repeat protein
MLLICSQNGHLNLIKMLVENGANVNARNLKGNTALHFSFTYGFEDLFRYLISKSADEYALNAEGLTCYEGLSREHIDKI